MKDKFPEDIRTFETRLEFLNILFSNCFEQKDIIAHCVMHKLDRSLFLYNEELEKSIKKLEESDPLYVLRRIK